MLALEAYCDESQGERAERVLCIAGYLGTAEAWNCFWGTWDRALTEEGLREFHMVDCESGRGEFDGMPQRRREQLQRRFIDIVTRPDFGLTAFATGIMLNAYDEMLPTIKKYRKIPPGLDVSGSVADPYFLVFQNVVETMAIFPPVRDLPPEERITFVFDNHHLDKRAAAVYRSILGSETLEYKGRLGEIRFGDSERTKPLQAADILAYEQYRYLSECHLDGTVLQRPSATRWQFEELTRGRADAFRTWGKEQLERLATVAEWI